MAQATAAENSQKVFELSQVILSQQRRIDALGAELARERLNWDSLYRSFTVSSNVCRKIAQKLSGEDLTAVTEEEEKRKFI